MSQRALGAAIAQWLERRTRVHTDSFSAHSCSYVHKNVTRVDNRAIKHIHHLLKQGHHQPGVVLDSHEILSQCALIGSGDSSVVRAPDSQERRDNLLLKGQISVLTLISASVPPPWYRSST